MTFSNTVLQTLDMTNNAFKPHGVHAIVGGKDEIVADAIAGIMSGVDLPQIVCKYMERFLLHVVHSLTTFDITSLRVSLYY